MLSEESKRYRKVYLNLQEPAQAIVPRKPVKVGRGKGLAVNVCKMVLTCSMNEGTQLERVCMAEDRSETESRDQMRLVRIDTYRKRKQEHI